MRCIVVYDISDSRLRVKIADLCMDYGMNRIQYSAFAGDLLRTHQEELMKRAMAKLGKRAGRICLYCIGEREWSQRIEHIVGDAPDHAAE
ncbi:MAG: CRISPR-associated endonuclease Cas2 [Chloroflexi bacterium]|jgi:CRISPR-associated protein Cas2|uniref:CRISPR-associated endoribonuclease Cas2 n=1 Tax=Candidatus Thermofonsia Clade 3 bacterium TaxID=2364212 RepID=A0A2M8QA12_9CHLR|nr:CRISPR-associated endonuclease Cas2 [Candidatus Roseilinea sp. NK_OTU-006]PJF46632.1 MAG: CRISPR-associated endonuclease Cas2 [Candidatus Thermofonsia Clade 3 bacterium]RMG61898.1 MAG: CRISPR-associated endonuclease Cas2 [Chloroflexota bacterium]